MRVPAILAISLAAVLAGSLLLVGPFSINSIIPKQSASVPQAEAQALPLMIRDRFAEIQRAGDAAAGSRFLKVDEEFIDPENHCEFCTRVEYTPGPRGQAGFSYEDPAGLDLSNARKVQFWAMGEEGNEEVKFKLAGKSLDRLQDRLQDRLANSLFQTELFALTTEEVTLEDQWKKYEVDLTGVDLEEITHPFAFELSENGGRQVIYFKGVVYDDEPAVDPLAATAEELVDPLVAEIISNATEGIAPATFEFEANVTGGTEPYSMSWDLGNDTAEGQNVVHMFEVAGEYNVTLTASDAGGQNASGSVLVQVAEPEVEDLDNDTLTDMNATDLQDENATDTLGETNATDTVDSNQTAAEPAEIEVDAGIDMVARSGDTIAIGAEIAGVEEEAEGLELEWTQESGPEAELSGDDSLNPTIGIPDLEDDAEIELELAASIGSAQDSDSVTIFVQHVDEVEDAQDGQLDPEDDVISEWAGECEDPAGCMSDSSDDTFAAATSEDAGDVNLFSFEEFDVENAEIEYVTAVATARSGGTGYLLFIGADEEDAEDQSEPDGAVPITSDSFDEYEFVWTENPVTGEPWTAESLNSFLAGYAYGDGDSDIEVSEFSLVVTYIVEEPEEAPPAEEEETQDEQAQDEEETLDETEITDETEEPDDTGSESEEGQNSEQEENGSGESTLQEEQGDPENTNSTSE